MHLISRDLEKRGEDVAPSSRQRRREVSPQPIRRPEPACSSTLRVAYKGKSLTRTGKRRERPDPNIDRMRHMPIAAQLGLRVESKSLDGDRAALVRKVDLRTIAELVRLSGRTRIVGR